MKPTWSPTRVLSAGALAAWAGLFWFLILSGRTRLYLSPRTGWVVPVGAILLTIAAIGRFASARVRHTAPLRNREAWGVGLMVLPVVAILALPPQALGSYAASKRSSFIAAGFEASAEDIATGDLSLIDVAGAVRSDETMQALVARAGDEVSFVGFITREDGQAADEFLLSRFIISCCVADALSVQVRIVGAPPGQFKEDDWVQVTGNLYPLGREVVVQASEVVGVHRPEHPYLSP